MQWPEPQGDRGAGLRGLMNRVLIGAARTELESGERRNIRAIVYRKTPNRAAKFTEISYSKISAQSGAIDSTQGPWIILSMWQQLPTLSDSQWPPLAHQAHLWPPGAWQRSGGSIHPQICQLGILILLEG